MCVRLRSLVGIGVSIFPKLHTHTHFFEGIHNRAEIPFKTSIVGERDKGGRQGERARAREVRCHKPTCTVNHVL